VRKIKKYERKNLEFVKKENEEGETKVGWSVLVLEKCHFFWRGGEKRARLAITRRRQKKSTGWTSAFQASQAQKGDGSKLILAKKSGGKSAARASHQRWIIGATGLLPEVLRKSGSDAREKGGQVNCAETGGMGSLERGQKDSVLLPDVARGSGKEPACVATTGRGAGHGV